MYIILSQVLSGSLSSDVPMDESWPVVGQFSSIGSLGPASHSWLCSEWLLSLSTLKKTGPTSMHKYPNLQLVGSAGYCCGVLFSQERIMYSNDGWCAEGGRRILKF